MLDDEPEEETEDRINLGSNLKDEPKGNGLADLETGSEVYMSEMLGFEIEDAEEMEEHNEEDLIGLDDPYADIDLKDHIRERLNGLPKETFLECYKNVPEKDRKLVQKHLKIPK